MKTKVNIKREKRPLVPRDIEEFPLGLYYDPPKLRPKEYFVLDFETTGLEPTAKITEVACCRVWKGNVISCYNSFVSINEPVPYEITQLTGITNQDVALAPPLQQVAEELADYLGTLPRPLFAHNASFETKHLFTSGIVDLISPDNPICCSLLLAKRAFPNFSSYSLENLADRLNLYGVRHHRAQDDVFLTSQLIETCYNAIENGITKESEQLEIPLMFENPPCPRCESVLVAKDGFTQAGTQMYRCKSCGKKFH